MEIGPPELIIVLFVVLLLFGPGRIKNVGEELGRSIAAFRRGLRGPDESSPSSDSEEDAPTR